MPASENWRHGRPPTKQNGAESPMTWGHSSRCLASGPASCEIVMQFFFISFLLFSFYSPWKKYRGWKTTGAATRNESLSSAGLTPPLHEAAHQRDVDYLPGLAATSKQIKRFKCKHLCKAPGDIESPWSPSCQRYEHLRVQIFMHGVVVVNAGSAKSCSERDNTS